jgi:16S rRNA (guanine527-N7)-methyltransferase
MQYQEFCDSAGFDVSRETFARLELYAELLEKWQNSINLVSKNTLTDMWQRHFLDSAQLYPLVKEKTGTLADIGSGAGFPGLVLAVLGIKDVHLVESDIRKAVFLREVARACDAPVKVHACRIEESPVRNAEIVTARALAALPQLLDYAAPLLKEGGSCIFLKGQTAEEEVAAAQENWKFSIKKQPSITGDDGVVLVLEEIARL